MIISFFGHSSIYNCNDLSQKVKEAILKSTKDDNPLIFYCGGYGDFDNLCVHVCQSLKNDAKKLK